MLLGGAYLSPLFLGDDMLSVPLVMVAGVVGTYLFFSQGGVALLARLRANRRVMWTPDALFVISQMAYKLRDNVGTLFLATIGFNSQIANFRIMIFSFITLLFFLGAGNVLYFRLFTDLPEDRRQFQALCKLGLGMADIRRIIGVQMAVVFFLPGLFAAVSTLFIQVRIVPKVGPLAFPILAGVLLVYGLLQGLYFQVTRRTHMRS